MYHGLGDGGSLIETAPALFAWQMKWLCNNGVRVVPLSQLVRRLLAGSAPPDRTVAITFDDGLESVYTRAFPILSRYGLPSTVFLVADRCGKWNDWRGQPPMVPRLPLLTWAEVEEMDRAGIEFGAHGLGHLRLDTLPPSDFSHEVLASKTLLEDKLGHSVELFSYPYGQHSSAVRTIVQQAYAGACTAQPGLVTVESDPLALPRLDAHYVAHSWLFRQISRPFFPAYVRLRQVVRTAAYVVLRRPWR
jgi:peptidoglycan/xylan/chitin deacetylase (PgdA/CDA1 family)